MTLAARFSVAAIWLTTTVIRMITIESTAKEIHVTIPRDDVDVRSLDAVLRWLEFDGIARTSKMTGDEAFQLAEESKADWWEKNRDRFLPPDSVGN